MTLRTFRDRMRQLSPPWLQSGNAERLLYALAVQVDACADALLAGVRARFPGQYAPDETLPLLGRERRIVRGPYESNGTYAARLRRWLDDHRRRGGPYALLAQLHAYYSPNTFAIDLLYRSGRRYRMNAAGVVTRDDTGFTPDSTPARWARWWLYLYTSTYALPLSAEDKAAASLVPREWNAAHCQGTLVIVPGDAEFWNFPLGHVWNESGTWNTTDVAESITIE